MHDWQTWPDSTEKHLLQIQHGAAARSAKHTARTQHWPGSQSKQEQTKQSLSHAMERREPCSADLDSCLGGCQAGALAADRGSDSA